MLRRAACALGRPAWQHASEAAAASTSGSATTSATSAAAGAWPMLLCRRHAGSSSRVPPPRMPAEYERYYGNVSVPVARTVKAEGGSAHGATAAPTTAGAAATSTSASAADAQAGAAAASAWMFPWERRQLDGAPGGLRPWEKAYWGLFVGGMALLLGSRLYRSQTAGAAPTPESEAEAAAKAAAQAEAARALLLGKSFVGDDDEDPLEGLSPDDIQALAEKTIGAGASSADPFDGWSPEEINEWVEKNGAGAMPPTQ